MGNLTQAKEIIGLPNSVLVKTALNATGTAPIYACRAWVNFNGTGTVAIRASGNVSSITDNGVGDYTVNFTVPMPDANFVGECMIGDLTQVGQIGAFIGANSSLTNSAFRFRTGYYGTNTFGDYLYVLTSIHR